MNVFHLAGILGALFAITPSSVFTATPPWGAQPSRVVWSMDGARFTYVLTNQDPQAAGAVYLYEVRTKTARVLIEPSRLTRHAKTPSALSFSPDGKRVVFLEKGTAYVLDVSGGAPRAIAREAGDPQWSPRGDAVAYVHKGDVYVSYVGGATRRVTHGGVDSVVTNGDLDWVYPEELELAHGFVWSPDAAEIAYLRMDERRVTNFPLVDFLPNDNKVDYERYPLAGESNPAVQLRVAEVGTANDRLVYDAARRDEYVAAFDWKPHSRSLVAEVLDRRQQHVRFVAFDGSTQTTLYAQRSQSWINVRPLPKFLRDGRSVWLLDRGGSTGVFVRTADGTMKPVFSGHTALSLPAIDANERTAYVTAAFPTRRDRTLLAVPLTGGPVRVLTPGPGSHQVFLPPQGTGFVVTSSTLNEPDHTDLVDSKTSASTPLTSVRNDLKDALLPIEMLDVDSTYGKLDATMLRPSGFDPAKRYPVVVYVYGGPSAPVTANVFGGQRALYHQLLARAGFIVFSIDGPGSQIGNWNNERVLDRNFGPGSLAGQEIGARYLASLPYVDPARIGIWGWSFGGYETCFALTHSTLFKAGAAVAPVTDWHLYDSIYTERYMGLPSREHGAYEASSVLNAAQHLHGPLLVQHGTADNNVHMANTMSLLQKFVDARETRVSFYSYPRRTHSIDGLAQRRTLYERMLNFWIANL